MKYIKFFSEIDIDDISSVGGKNASLGEMYNSLDKLGIKIPNGFATTSEAYWLLIEQNNLKDKIKSILLNLDIKDIKNLQKKGKKIRELILNAKIPLAVVDEIKEAYKILSKKYGKKTVDVAIRSSGTAEDLPDASFAGQQDTFLNINNEKELMKSVKKCYASLFNDRAISYRQSRGYDHLKVALSVGVQKMVRSDKSSSGIMFTIDTETGSKDLIMINSIFGLGENIVGGKVIPDEFYVFKPTLKKGISTILKKQLGSKQKKMIYSGAKLDKTKNISLTKKEQNSFSLNDDEIIKLALYGLKIEEHYSKLSGSYRAMDIEWAKDGDTNELFIVQARPETIQNKKQKENKKYILKNYKLLVKENDKKSLISGQAVGDKIGAGVVKIITKLSQSYLFNDGDILVANTTDPDWEPLMKKASAVVTNKGGRTCHAAIVAREIGVPAVVGCINATKLLKDGNKVTVSCADGETGYVYQGILKYEIQKINIKNLKEPKTKLFMNVGDPKKAFLFSKLPNQGVGLARMEFIINNYIKAHPMALFDMQNGIKVQDEQKIKKFIKGYKDPKSFFINKLSQGIAMIAAAFYPKPVIVRTSDFKSNEYKNMPGGKAYEQDEENPMIGFRGASRYYSKQYQKAFEWECEALKKVRDEMGLTNVKIMLPFVRTPVEGKKVIKIMNKKGLIQGKNTLEIYAMCEIPSNVIFADEFLKVFDGYSIGSNDLTQLTLGVDRDSALISHIFDERNEAVKRMLKMAIKACKKKGKYIGICGQAPSDYPEITKFLVENNIDSISLNPDSILRMRQVVVELEGKGLK
ncbi:MAG: phosphoenolpyruvate synthase [Arcobacteraceae bacterium]|nr:phosphoenolpyruvate synthase [Arcobacteraceae bacterium]